MQSILTMDDVMVEQMAKTIDYMSDEEKENWSYKAAQDWVSDQIKYEAQNGTPLPYDIEDVYDTIKAMLDTL